MKKLISFAAVSLLGFASMSVAHADDGAFQTMDEMQQQANERIQEMQRQSAENAQREADEAQFRAQQAQEQQRLDSLAPSP